MRVLEVYAELDAVLAGTAVGRVSWCLVDV